MDYPEVMRGRCRTCGFLAKRYVGQRLLPFVWYKLREEDRMYGMAFRHTPDTGVGEVSTVPACFVHEADLWVMPPGTATDDGQNRDRARGVFQEERVCLQWYSYTPDVDPVKHWEARNLERLDDLRRQNDFKIAELNLRSQESTQATAEATAEATRKAGEATQAANEMLLRITQDAHGSSWKYTVAF